LHRCLAGPAFVLLGASVGNASNELAPRTTWLPTPGRSLGAASQRRLLSFLCSARTRPRSRKMPAGSARRLAPFAAVLSLYANPHLLRSFSRQRRQENLTGPPGFFVRTSFGLRILEESPWLVAPATTGVAPAFPGCGLCAAAILCKRRVTFAAPPSA